MTRGWQGVDLIVVQGDFSLLTRSASEAETAEFLTGASGWYDHEPQKSLNQQTASALRLTGSFRFPIQFIKQISQRSAFIFRQTLCLDEMRQQRSQRTVTELVGRFLKLTHNQI